MDNPEAGTQSFPLAKSPQARMILGGLVVATVIATLVFGLVGGAVGVVIAGLVGRRMEHNPVKERYQRRGSEAASRKADNA